MVLFWGGAERCNPIFMIICTNHFHLWPAGHCLTRIYYCKCLQIGIAINFLDLSSFLLFEAPRVLLRIENVSKHFFWLFPFFILSPPGSDPPEKHLCFISNLSSLVDGWVSAFWLLGDVCSLKKLDSFVFLLNSLVFWFIVSSVLLSWFEILSGWFFSFLLGCDKVWSLTSGQ